MIKPTTVYLGEKANELLKELSAENGMLSRFFFVKLITREARAEATTLSGDKLKARLQLINDVEDELVNIINDPPREMVADWDYSMNPKAIYMRVWTAHKRLESQGKTQEEIHEYCIKRYGVDYPVKETPQRSPKANPEWVGGGRASEKIKQAKKASKKIEVQ